MPKRVFVTGASGFVGSAVVEELLARDYDITALLHRGRLQLGADRVRVVRGDLFSATALDEAVAGCDAVIHLVGIIKEDRAHGVTFERVHYEAAKNVMEAAARNRVRRFVHMSAFGTRANAASRYHQTKYQAEQALRTSGLDWTIFQPSLIHGPQGEFLKMEADWARGKRPPFLFMPYFGGGILGRCNPTHIQPVYVNDVARAFVDALERPQAIGQTYGVCGSQRLTWPQMHRIVATVLTGGKKPALAIPAWYAGLLTRIVPAKLLPFTRDQVIMAREDVSCDMSRFLADFGWEPAAFDATLREYAKEMQP